MAARIRTSQIEMWIPWASWVTPTDPKWNFTCSNCPEASQPALYAPMA